MRKQSAGILLYRRKRRKLEVLLVHPGGPFWAKRDLGAWSIPKGEVEKGEDLLARARQELKEETGFSCDGPFLALRPVQQSSKVVHAWAAQGDGDPDSIVSNTVTLEYPPRSGRFLTIPEVDKAGWFDLTTARQKLLPGQRDLVRQLEERLEGKAVRA
jgi:predicted NUDIX family NTP pyrophosphohydrolase